MDFKAIGTVIGGGGGDTKILWPSHLLVRDQRCCFRQVCCNHLTEIPVEVQEEIKAELFQMMVFGEDTIAYSSESSYAANLENGNERVQTNRVVTEDQVALGNTRCQID